MDMIVKDAITVAVTRLPHGAGIDLPAYETPHAAGMDLKAALNEGEAVTLTPGTWALIPTGLSIALPEGYEAQVRPRSGLAAKHGVTVLNSPGTVDADYRGEIKVILINHGTEPFAISRGMRIAQMVVTPVAQAHWQEVTVLPDSMRGGGGFGSTGI